MAFTCVWNNTPNILISQRKLYLLLLNFYPIHHKSLFLFLHHNSLFPPTLNTELNLNTSVPLWESIFLLYGISKKVSFKSAQNGFIKLLILFNDISFFLTLSFLLFLSVWVGKNELYMIKHIYAYYLEWKYFQMKFRVRLI